MKNNPFAPFRGAHAQTYAERPRRQVPGFDDLHKMTSMLLAERTPETGHVLVLGAGGGLELETLAGDHPGWTFTGVDPSADMLETARRTARSHMERIALVEGTITAAPDGPFDAACCLLTFHFIPRDARLETLKHIRARLVPGAPFVLAHISFSQDEPARTRWIDRHIAYAGTDPAHAKDAHAAIAERLTILAPQDEEAMLAAAGFEDVTLFYAGLSFRGWVAYAGATT